MYKYTQNVPEQSETAGKRQDRRTESSDPMTISIENAYSLPLEDIRIYRSVSGGSGHVVRQMQGPLQKSAAIMNQTALSEDGTGIIFGRSGYLCTGIPKAAVQRTVK